MKTLYQIQNQYHDIIDRLEQHLQTLSVSHDGPGVADDTDWLSPEQIDQLNAELAINAAEFADKADAYAAAIGQKRARAEFLKAEAKRLTDMAKAEDAVADRLQQRISEAMWAQGLSKTETAHYRLSFRKSTSVEVSVPTEELPVLYQRSKLIHEPDKTAIKKALQLGGVIPGARLVETQSLQIR